MNPWQMKKPPLPPLERKLTKAQRINDTSDQNIIEAVYLHNRFRMDAARYNIRSNIPLTAGIIGFICAGSFLYSLFSQYQHQHLFQHFLQRRVIRRGDAP
jgi:hypothetical protein